MTPSRALAIADARIARCTCGAWVYDHQPCGTCGLSHAARATDRVAS